MKTPQRRRLARGFTLVELLVVITIIIVLAALGLGMSRSAMTKSRLSTSLNKVRDLGARVGAYQTDHGGMLPVYRFENDNLYWWGVLVEDPRNESQLDVFKSPNDKYFDVKKIENTISYGWNAEVMGRSDTASSDSGDGPRRMSNFSNPGRILMIADGPKGGRMGLLEANTLPDVERYNGKAAAVFLDGSGRILDIASEFKGTNKWFVDPDRTGQD